MASAARSIRIRHETGYSKATFLAMGSPCELLVEADSQHSAKELAEIVAAEAWRIEDKFSRYICGNIVDRINMSGGEVVQVDEETANLIDFAETLFEMSDGRFDITSGVLREAWTFDGGDQVPDPSTVARILERVGWNKLRWRRPELALRPGMQIDFGGIAKEYGVDKAAALLTDETDDACLVNFGGDLVATGTSSGTDGWQVGIDAFNAAEAHTQKRIRLQNGGLATSGDARRFLQKDGIRYGHILDPTTGWPVRDAPRSITVAADTCTQAGMLATLAMLRGAGATTFLEQQGIRHWCYR